MAYNASTSDKVAESDKPTTDSFSRSITHGSGLNVQPDDSASQRSSARSRSRSKGAVCFEATLNGEQKRVRLANDVEAGMAGSVEVMEPDAREFAAALPQLRLAGSGARLADCGVEMPGLFCPRCGGSMVVGRTCRRSVCPRCWESWAFAQAKTNAAMVEGVRRYRAASGDSNAKYHHLTVSFPVSTRFDSMDPRGRGSEAVKLLLGEVGVYAGIMIYHPWRIAEEYRGDVQGHESGDGDMTWAEILTKIESSEWSWAAVRDELLVYAPHYHVFANAPFVQGGAVTEAIEEQTGVVIHRITKGEDSSVSLYDLEDLTAAMAYSLSHVGLAWNEENEEYRAAYRRFGETANFSPTPSVEADVDTALRKVAPEVLGIEFPEPRCDSETVELPEQSAAENDPEPDRPSSAGGTRSLPDGSLPDGSRDSPNDNADTGGWPDGAGNNWSSGNTGGYAVNDDRELWTATEGVTPEWLEDPAEAPAECRSRCGAKLKPMWAAEEYLADEEWVESIGEEARAELAAAYREWERVGEPYPDNPPPDTPDPPE
jgi:hypothetical protein